MPAPPLPDITLAVVPPMLFPFAPRSSMTPPIMLPPDGADRVALDAVARRAGVLDQDAVKVVEVDGVADDRVVPRAGADVWGLPCIGSSRTPSQPLATAVVPVGVGADQVILDRVLRRVLDRDAALAVARDDVVDHQVVGGGLARRAVALDQHAGGGVRQRGVAGDVRADVVALDRVARRPAVEDATPTSVLPEMMLCTAACSRRSCCPIAPPTIRRHRPIPLARVLAEVGADEVALRPRCRSFRF